MRRVLILGADGFIGRHLAFGMRANGWQVIACARRTARLDRMGFATLRADLSDSETHDPAFWKGHIGDGPIAVINSAGLLTGSEAQMQAVHVSAPRALYQALPAHSAGVLISAVGIDTAQTRFSRYRRDGEAIAQAHDITVLRAGLVMADTSYGGTSLARALAALPLVTPVVGDGQQRFNPIHAADLAQVVQECLTDPPPPGIHQIGGPDTVSQTDMLAALRGWMGLPPARVLRLPVSVARLLGTLGDALRFGPISRTAVDQLSAGALAETGNLLDGRAVTPRGYSTFLAARPAGTQDLWHARLYLFRPFLRLVLAALWLGSGLLGLILPADNFLPLIQSAILPDSALILLARAGGLADLAIALALLRGWRPRWVAGLQAALILAYTLVFSALAPALWLLPLGGLLKNLPLLALVAIQGILEDER
ncbi:NAD-dependent epimerase/dehydratase family protein [Seohaeicola saemankumensis]|nr:DoxX-like family protein [Seohaeicola saemankumensis]MCA0870943.1 NAD-dependent epimerase/dehydratase family protein [Seohaeicola saemankumensis]